MQKSGFALGFFATLRNAIYGEQEKEAMSLKKANNPKKHMKKAKLGILARIQETGSQQFLSPIPTEGEESETDASLGIEPRTPQNSLNEKSQKNNGYRNTFVRKFTPPENLKIKLAKKPNFSYGVPGKTGTGALKLNDLGTVPNNDESTPQIKQKDENSFVGSLTNMFFGRKGGLF